MATTMLAQTGATHHSPEPECFPKTEGVLLKQYK